MTRRKESPPSREVVVQHEGKTYTGSYTVQRDVMTVSSSWGTKSTQIGGSPADVLARVLLGELVGEHRPPSQP